MIGKTRNPVTVWLLVLVTFGIYGLYWWYKANEEVNKYDPSIEVNPTLAVLALFVPIVNFVTVYRTGARIGQAQANKTGTATTSGVLGIVLAFLLALDFPYYQSGLNSLWANAGAAPPPPPAPAA